MKVTPLQIAVETTNILTTIIPKVTTYFMYRWCLLLTAVTFNSWLMLINTALYHFHEICCPPPPQVHVMLPYLKMTSQNQSRFWTWPHSKMASPHHSPLISLICVIIWSLNLTAVTGTTETASLAGGGTIKFKCTFWPTPRNWKADQLASGRGRY